MEYPHRFLEFLGRIQNSILNRLPSQVDTTDCKPLNWNRGLPLKNNTVGSYM
jgi:hypothetical protein